MVKDQIVSSCHSIQVLRLKQRGNMLQIYPPRISAECPCACQSSTFLLTRSSQSKLCHVWRSLCCRSLKSRLLQETEQLEVGLNLRLLFAARSQIIGESITSVLEPVCVCVCARARARVCVCVCVYERERERRGYSVLLHVHACDARTCARFSVLRWS